MSVATRGRILVVEYDQALAATLRDELEEQGFAVDPAVTADEALRKVLDEPPSLVLLDLHLPTGTLDSLTFLTRLREAPRTRQTPVIVLGSVGEEETIRVAIERGASAHFAKTRYSLPDLLDRIEMLLGSSTLSSPTVEPPTPRR